MDCLNGLNKTKKQDLMKLTSPNKMHRLKVNS
jgi:hypothetical protein